MTRARRRQAQAALARDVHPSRRLRDGGEQRHLRPGKILDRLVEIKARGMGDAMAVQCRKARAADNAPASPHVRGARRCASAVAACISFSAKCAAARLACARPAWRWSRRLRVCRASSDCAMRRAAARGRRRRDDRKSGDLRERASRAPCAAELRRAANSRNRRAGFARRIARLLADLREKGAVAVVDDGAGARRNELGARQRLMREPGGACDECRDKSKKDCARQPSPACGRGWLRSSRVRGYDLFAMRLGQTGNIASPHPTPLRGATLSPSGRGLRAQFP